MSLRTRGVRALVALAAVAVLAGCEEDAPPPGTLTVESPVLGPQALAACSAVLADLPDTLLGQASRTVSTADRSVAAAWGDPAVVLRCGVPAPVVADLTQECAAVVNGVGWLGPDISQSPPEGSTTFQAVSREPIVELEVPEAYYDQSGSALAALAPALKTHLTRAQRCV